MAGLKAILFDIDDTLYSTRDFAGRARRNALEAMRRLGLRIPIDELYAELEEVVREFGSNYPEHYHLLLRRIPPIAYRDVNPGILVAAAVAAYHDTKHRWLVPHKDAVSLLKSLARTSLVRGVISDGLEVKQAEKILRLGLYPLFTPGAIFISEQIGISKPNPKIYARACARLAIPPEQILYIGNSMAQDIRPARKAGLRTVFIRRGGREDDPAVTADHTIDNFDELRQILRKEYGVRIG
jgi:putative hydrolase of the HAD superfamily